MKKKASLSISLLIASFVLMIFFSYSEKSTNIIANREPLKIYWFIPDGFRAEPVIFKVYEWAKNGKLPNIKKLIEQGSRGYSVPVFPGHTPTNFATLMTGTTPDVHGVTDGRMRLEGYPIKMASLKGFSSNAKIVPPIWNLLEQNNLKVSLLSVPGSTPPELNKGITIMGRWGGWGPEFPATIFHTSLDKDFQENLNFDSRIFRSGIDITLFRKPMPKQGWAVKIDSFSEPREVKLSNWESPLYALIYDSKNDNKENYDCAIFSKDKIKTIATLCENDWSPWLPTSLFWEIKNDYRIDTPKKMPWEREISKIKIDTEFKIKIIKLGKKDFFRIRVLYNNLNQFLVRPNTLFDSINQNVGPMVDFVDNFPPQLIFFQEDKKTFLEELNLSFDWHDRMTKYLINTSSSNIIIHSIYNPNQMLVSRWWLPYLDPNSMRYNDIAEDERKMLWNEVLSMYQQIDKMIGTILTNAAPNTYVILSSDHGVLPLNTDVLLNNLFAKKGWLKFHHSTENGANYIDWENSKVVFLESNSIYIDPNGFSGTYFRQKGREYEDLRNLVMKEISLIKDPNGLSPIAHILKYEEAKKLHLNQKRVGDIVISGASGYYFSESISNNLNLFQKAVRGGYKSPTIPSDHIGMLTPFVIKGPGIKKGYEIKKPINHIDQYATILKILNIKIPEHSSGKVVHEIFEQK